MDGTYYCGAVRLIDGYTFDGHTAGLCEDVEDLALCAAYIVVAAEDRDGIAFTYSCGTDAELLAEFCGEVC